ncbi:lipopolysaccharide biosynthesis protein [Ferrimonas balearica]|uniref:lipopolysaccharide biosynthesis protein n=1 Tax=Ferrimonas balearica TaxID=44012 RepID=UPI001C99C53E|nr:lipopolysaccharide biosynthesis protein [Ferrimonas balearica]MBY5921264.1 lipopolysaccharide biosynthesis protein [Ferrimonas balearica]MBY5996051.1 lipopolysaccharide biosynthesis protein [Ferrimonas balearica]
MTQTAIKNVEQRFVQLREVMSAQEWNSVAKLLAKAKSLENQDAPLARRLAQRAKNLEPDNPKVLSELTRLNRLVQQQQPAADISRSSERRPGRVVVLNQRLQKALEHPKMAKAKTPWFLGLILPILVFAFYQLVWASPRYESRAQLIVQQPDGMATMDMSMALLSGFGVSTPATSDSQLVKAFIASEDMLKYLDDKLSLRDHYSQSTVDMFTRLNGWSTQEDFLRFYQNHTVVEIDEKSNVITVKTQGFDAEFAKHLSQAIVERAEWYINSLGHQLAEAQLEFIKGEHRLVEQRLEKAKRELLGFQQQFNLLDPEAEGMALQQITYGLEAQLATKKAELKSLLSIMSTDAPQVLVIQSQIRALEAQLEVERGRLSLQQGNGGDSHLAIPGDTGYSVSEVLAKYASLKIELELALQAYTASEVSLEKSRVEAYRKLKYLMTVESSTLPEDNQYPQSTYNILLFSVVLMMLFGIGRIILATVKELK